MRDTVTWKIGGEAGFGIMSAGIMLSRIYARSGYRTFATNEYPSLIRGGLNLVTVRISTKSVDAMSREQDVLVALTKKCVEECKKDLSENSIVIYDPKDGEYTSDDFPKPVRLMPVPLLAILHELNASLVMRNTIAMGATLAVLGGTLETFSQIIKEQFGRKGDEVVNANIAVAQKGYDYVKNTYGSETSMHLAPGGAKEELLIINGSEALGVSAVRAGLKFAAIYPMTPINSVITYLADHAKKYNIMYVQPEDEISGINMALGASVAGVRSMVATSGGGFALMVEGLSLAGMIEAPLVIDMGMRVGPATGMPTWTESSELDFVISAGHGEFPRIVLAPGDAEDVFDLTTAAFNLADRYQVPVFLLTDKYLNESHWCVPKNYYARTVAIDRGKMITEDIPDSETYLRYRTDVDDGVSPRTVTGVANGNFISNSYEHRQDGLMTEEANERRIMVDKRNQKFAAIQSAAIAPAHTGDDNADITFVTWGTTKGPVREAIKLLSGKNIKANMIHFTWLYPFPEKAHEMLKKAKRLVLVEQNSMGQLGGLIRKYTGIHIEERILKYDGRPFFPEEIVKRMTL